MTKSDATQSGVMARLTLSALERASQDPDCWREPVVHRALLVSGLSVLTAATRHLQDDLEEAEAA
ncbi:hypothetical protein Q3Y53_06875 [Synechococcus sp. YX-04-1]|uniref:hypothetical protein n=1 Tax=Synechococcus sp. YX-04-1 TaxID=3062778 RepID=UPI0026E4696B|nr:hypothetical protein [Synechococcus sp. YX-04-1]MDO6352265.1 hypothetical protein [Synechococcus sp. YX-04-1]